MSKWLFLIVASLLQAPYGWASKARLEALSQSNMGSFLIQDERNVFSNPALIHRVDRLASFEWGASGTAIKVDSEATPKAEGGWYDGKARNPYAIYLGNEEPTVVYSRNIQITDFLKPDNTVDLTLGFGNGSLKFGAGLSLSKNRDEATGGIERNEEMVVIRGGVLLGEQWEIFGNIHLLDRAQGAAANDDKYVSKPAGLVGLIYNWRQFRVYAEIFKKDVERTPAGGENLEFKRNIQQLGIGEVRSVSAQGRLFWNVDLKQEASVTDYSTSSKGETSWLHLNVGVGVEDRIRDWLTLRGSVTQAVLLNEANTKLSGGSEDEYSVTDTTLVMAGLGLHFDSFKLDGSFTTYGGTLTGTNLMSRVSMSYLY